MIRKHSVKVENLNKDTLKISAEEDVDKPEEFDDDFGSLLADCDDFYAGGGTKLLQPKIEEQEEDPMHEFM